jgi:hypothetical protein
MNRLSTNPTIFIIIFILIFYYPVLAIFISAYIMIYEKRLNNYIIFFYTIIFFSLIFYFRLYGNITSIKGSTDDAIVYLKMYSILEKYHYIDFFNESLKRGINAIEPIHWLFFYLIGLLTSFDKNIFVFLNYFIPIYLFMLYLRLLFKELYLLAFLLISTFAYQYYYALVFSAWRQSLATPLIFLSLYLLGRKKNNLAIFIMIGAILIHFSSIIYLFIYLLYLLISSKIKFYKMVISFLFLFISMYILLFYFNDIFIEKFSVYTEGKHIIESRINFIIKFTIAIAIAGFIFWRNLKFKDIQLNIISFFVLIGNLIVLLTMNLGTVTTRLQLSLNILFLIMVSYYVSKYCNFRRSMYIFIMLIVFIIFVKLTNDNTFFSMFLLNGKFDEILTYSVKDFMLLFIEKKGFE